MPLIRDRILINSLRRLNQIFPKIIRVILYKRIFIIVLLNSFNVLLLAPLVFFSIHNLRLFSLDFFFRKCWRLIAGQNRFSFRLIIRCIESLLLLVASPLRHRAFVAKGDIALSVVFVVEFFKDSFPKVWFGRCVVKQLFVI